MIRFRESYRVVRRPARPIPDGDHVTIWPPPPKPRADALTLLHAWEAAREGGHYSRAAAALAELERLAERRKKKDDQSPPESNRPLRDETPSFRSPDR